MTSARDRLEILRRYRSGKAKRTAEYVDAGVIVVPTPHRGFTDDRMLRDARIALGNDGHRLGHLPTADEQFAGRDPREEE